jgi:hypothetical protein
MAFARLSSGILMESAKATRAVAAPAGPNPRSVEAGSAARGAFSRVPTLGEERETLFVPISYCIGMINIGRYHRCRDSL